MSSDESALEEGIGFGEYLRALRTERGVGQRQLARMLSISPSYLNDIESEKRVAPRSELVAALARALDAEEERLFDLAGESRGTIPSDILSFVRERSELIPFLRQIRSYGLADEELQEMAKRMISSHVKVVVIAAGKGSRLKHHTKDTPKCLLNFGGKTLLERQIEAYNECGVSDISLVRGYRREKIQLEGVSYFENLEYENNNVLASVFCAEEAINGHVIIAYSDILFESEVVKRLLQSEAEISIVVDIDWRGYYVGRKDHPVEEAESVILDPDNKVRKIGKILTEKHDVHGEFIGMMKLSPRGAEIFKKHYHLARERYWDKPFQRAKVFQKAYLTDMIQEMVDLGVSIHCVIIERGWKEIDTVEDYSNALKEFAE